MMTIKMAPFIFQDVTGAVVTGAVAAASGTSDLGDLYAESRQTLQGSFSAGLGCIEAKFCK